MGASAEQAIEELIANPPALHWTEEGPQDWRVGVDVLRWLATNVDPHWRTLETGCGHSSIVFALKGAKHTIVAPHAPEHELVRKWCEDRGFSTERLTSVVDHSQSALPALDIPSLDLGLIDGGHAFPTPFIDWYYIAERLREGGRVIVDDMHIRTCRLLRDFLAAEKGRWCLEEELERAALFRKASNVVIPITDWAGQPWTASTRAHQRLSTWIRNAIRFRTRLRAPSW